MWAITGDGTWSKLYFKKDTTAGPRSLVGYYTSPEQRCFEEDSHHGSLGWMFDCKQRQVELDLQLELCNVKAPPTFT